MSSPSSISILAENLRRLMAHWNASQRRTRDSVRAFAVAHGLGDDAQLKALQRAMKGQTIQIDTLEMIAARIGIEPWHLLHPKFEPGRPLELEALSHSAARLAKAFDELPITEEKLTAFALMLEICEQTARGDALLVLTPQSAR